MKNIFYIMTIFFLLSLSGYASAIELISQNISIEDIQYTSSISNTGFNAIMISVSNISTNDTLLNARTFLLYTPNNNLFSSYDNQIIGLVNTTRNIYTNTSTIWSSQNYEFYYNGQTMYRRDRINGVWNIVSAGYDFETLESSQRPLYNALATSGNNFGVAHVNGSLIQNYPFTESGGFSTNMNFFAADICDQVNGDSDSQLYVIVEKIRSFVFALQSSERYYDIYRLSSNFSVAPYKTYTFGVQALDGAATLPFIYPKLRCVVDHTKLYEYQAGVSTYFNIINLSTNQTTASSSLSDSCNALSIATQSIQDMACSINRDVNDYTPNCLIGANSTAGRPLLYDFNGTECHYITLENQFYDINDLPVSLDNGTIKSITYDETDDVFYVGGKNLFFTMGTFAGSEVIVTPGENSSAYISSHLCADKDYLCTQTQFINGEFYCDIDNLNFCSNGCINYISDLNSSQTFFNSPGRSCSLIETSYFGGLRFGCSGVTDPAVETIFQLFPASAPLLLMYQCFHPRETITIPTTDCTDSSVWDIIDLAGNDTLYTEGQCINQSVYSSCTEGTFSCSNDKRNVLYCVNDSYYGTNYIVNATCSGNTECSNGQCVFNELAPEFIPPENDNEAFNDGSIFNGVSVTNRMLIVLGVILLTTLLIFVGGHSIGMESKGLTIGWIIIIVMEILVALILRGLPWWVGLILAVICAGIMTAFIKSFWTRPAGE